MPAELFVIVAAGLVVLQMAFVILRRAYADERSYLLLLAADLAALAYIRATGRDESPIAWFFVALAALFTLSPRFLDRWEARFVALGNLGAARRVALLRELIVPGHGSSLRRRQLDDLIEVRERGSAAVVRRLRNELNDVPSPRQAEALHEELVAMLLVDHRFAEATEHFARHLGAVFLARRPGLLPQLVRAFGELGDVTTAAILMAAVDAGPAGRDPMLFPLLQRARLLLLAYAGCDIEPLLSGPPGMLLHPEERAQLGRLARARALSGVAHPAEVEVVLEAELRRAAESLRLRVRRPAPATWTLVAVNGVCFLLTLLLVPGAAELMLHHSGSGASLVRAGALVRPAIFAGEWWRGVSALFLHADYWHIGMNMYGLIILGRFVEDLCGSLRFLIIYFAGGLLGSAASTLFGKGLSVGASGAILGLLGAMIVLVLLRRTNFAERWRRIVLWNLVLVLLVQIGADFFVSIIDNHAHIGGILGGAAGALLFAPGLLVGDGPAGRAVVRLFAAVCVALSLVALVQVARTPLQRTVDRLPRTTMTFHGLSLTVPRHWEVMHDPDNNQDVLVDRYLDIELQVEQGQIASPQEGDYPELFKEIRASARPAP
jgi:membrane associated rhomboid family serine protease